MTCQADTLSRAYVFIFACAFAIGGINHARDLALGGVLPYHAVPLSINVFWTALCPIDFALAAAVWLRRRTTVVAGVLVMLTDVGVNSWVGYFSGVRVSSFEPLQVQSMFLGFLLGGALFVLPPVSRPTSP